MRSMSNDLPVEGPSGPAETLTSVTEPDDVRRKVRPNSRTLQDLPTKDIPVKDVLVVLNSFNLGLDRLNLNIDRREGSILLRNEKQLVDADSLTESGWQ